MKKKNVILSSILSLVLCLSLIAGGTFALFTSESKTNISINSGKVEVVAEVTDLALYSQENIDVNTKVGTHIDVDGNTFPNGGTANYANGTLTLDKLTPGDGVTFNISVTNNSNVAIKYRTVISDATGSNLMNALEVSIGNVDYYGAVTGEWTSLEAEGTIAAIPVSIELPATAGNDYQGLTVSLSITVEAIQGNAVDYVASVNGNNYETFSEAVAAAQNGDTVEVLNGAIVQMPATVADGVTIKNATFNTPVKVSASTSTIEGDTTTAAAPVSFDSCTFQDNAIVSVADREVKISNCKFVDTVAGAATTSDLAYIYEQTGEATVTVENTTAEITIYTVDEWNEMSNIVNGRGNNFDYLTIKLGANLDFTGYTGYTPVSRRVADAPFAGTFDGQGHTISGLKFGSYNNVVSNVFGEGVDFNAGHYYTFGLFAEAGDGAIFKNFTLSNIYFGCYTSNGGGVVGTAHGDVTFENIIVEDALLIQARQTGALVGLTAENAIITIKNCQVNNSAVLSIARNVGILYGYVYENATLNVEGCSTTGSVTGTIEGKYNWGEFVKAVTLESALANSQFTPATLD